MTLEAQERQSVIKGCRARLRRELINELASRTPGLGVIETKASKKALRQSLRQWREVMTDRWETLPAPSKDEFKAAIIETINQTVKLVADQTIATFDRDAAADEIKEKLLNKILDLSNADFEQAIKFADQMRKEKDLLTYSDDHLNQLVEEFAVIQTPLITETKQMYENDLGEEIDRCVAKDAFEFSPLGGRGYEILGTSTIELANKIRERLATMPEWSYAEYLMSGTRETVENYAKRLQLNDTIISLLASLLPDSDRVLYERLNQMLKQAHAKHQLMDTDEISLVWIYNNRNRAWQMVADYQTFVALLGGERVLPSFADTDQSTLWPRLEQLVSDEYQTFKKTCHAEDEGLDVSYCNNRLYEVVRSLADDSGANDWESFQATLLSSNLIATDALSYFQTNSSFVDQKRLETLREQFNGMVPTMIKQVKQYIAERVENRFQPQTPRQRQAADTIVVDINEKAERNLKSMEHSTALLRQFTLVQSADKLKDMLLDMEYPLVDEQVKTYDERFARAVRQDLQSAIQDMAIAPMEVHLLEAWVSALDTKDLLNIGMVGIENSLQKALNDLKTVSADDDVDAKKQIFKGLLVELTTDAKQVRNIQMEYDELEHRVVAQAEADVWDVFWPEFRKISGSTAVEISRFVGENRDAMLECWLNSFDDSLRSLVKPVYQQKLEALLHDQMSDEQIKQAGEAVLQGDFYNYLAEYLAHTTVPKWRDNSLYLKQFLPAVTAKLMEKGRKTIGSLLEQDGLTGNYDLDGIIAKTIQQRLDMSDLLWVIDNYAGTEIMSTVVDKAANNIDWNFAYIDMIKPELLRRLIQQYLEKLSDQGVNDADARAYLALLSEQDLPILNRALHDQIDLLEPLTRLGYVPQETGDDEMDEQRILDKAYEKAMREYEDERYFDEEWWNSTYDARLSALLDGGDAVRAQQYLNGEITLKELLDVSDDVAVPREVAEQIKQKLTEKLIDAIGERLDEWAYTATGGLGLNLNGDQIEIEDTALKLKCSLVKYVEQAMPSDAEIDNLAVVCDENKGDPGETASLYLEQLSLPDDADFESDNAESLTSQFHEWLREAVTDLDAETGMLIERVPLHKALQASLLEPLDKNSLTELIS